MVFNMKKAVFVLLIASILLFQPLANSTTAQEATYTPKNLGKLAIVILLDGLDYRVFESISTPNLDELGASGYLFHARGILPSSTTAATTAIVTGAYPNASGVVHTYAFNADEYHKQLPGETPMKHYFSEMLNATTIFETLFEKGVHTALISAKTKLEVLLGKSGSVEKYIYVDWRDFFSIDPHEPGATFEQRAELLETMTNDTLSVIESFKPYIEKGEDAFIFLAYPEPDWSGHAAGPTSELYKNIAKFMDSEVGRIVTKLKELELWSRTLMILTPDHGYSTVDPLLNILDPNDPMHLPGLTVEHVVSTTAGMLLYIYLKDINDTQKAVDELWNYPWTNGIWTRLPAERTNGTLEDIGLNSPYAGDIVLDIKPPYYASTYENYGAHGGTDATQIPIIVTGGAIDTTANIQTFNQLLIAPTIAKFLESELPSKAFYTDTPVKFKPSAKVEFTFKPKIAEPNSEITLNINYTIEGTGIQNAKLIIDVVDSNHTRVSTKTIALDNLNGSLTETISVGPEGVTTVYVYIVDSNNNVLGGKAQNLLVAKVEKPPRDWSSIMGASVLAIILAVIMVALPIALKKGYIHIKFLSE